MRSARPSTRMPVSRRFRPSLSWRSGALAAQDADLLRASLAIDVHDQIDGPAAIDVSRENLLDYLALNVERRTGCKLTIPRSAQRGDARGLTGAHVDDADELEVSVPVLVKVRRHEQCFVVGLQRRSLRGEGSVALPDLEHPVDEQI